MSDESMERAILETLRARCKKELDVDLDLTTGIQASNKLWGIVGYYMIDVWFTDTIIKLRAAVPLRNLEHLIFNIEFDIYDPYSIDRFIELIQKYKVESTAKLMPYAIKQGWPP